MILRRNFAGIVGQLANEGLLDDAQVERAKRLGEGHVSATAPWFVRALIGLGAWVTAGLFVLMLALADVLDSAAMTTVLGVVGYLGAVGLRRTGDHGDFVSQLTLSMGLGGAVMVVAGLGRHEDWVAVLVALAMSVVTVAIYPDTLMRFIGGAGIGVTFVMLFHELRLGPDTAVALVALAAGALWHFEPRLVTQAWWRPMQRPLAWGLLLSAMMFVGLQALEVNDFKVSAAVSVTLAIAMVALVVGIVREHRAGLLREAVVVLVASVLLVGVLTVSVPAVMGGLYAATLAFHRRSPLLLTLALTYFVVFIGVFYFRDDQTLLRKALVMLSMGALILALREYARRRFGPITVEENP